MKLEEQKIGLGTWVLAGYFLGGPKETEIAATLHVAIHRGIHLIDTAPLYGFGNTEEAVGRALQGRREKVLLATKFGLSWKEGKIYRDARKETVLKEAEGSLKRLNTDWIDLYQLHWPDPLTPVAETAEALQILLDQGKIKAVGLSNVSLADLLEFQKHLAIKAVQLPYNLFERGIETDILPYCQQEKIPVLGYSALCRGLLSGTLTPSSTFRKDDLCSFDPKFQEPYYSRYLACVKRLSDWVREKFGRPLFEVAIRWMMEKGTIPLWGPSKELELIDLNRIHNFKMSPHDLLEISRIIDEEILHPIGIEFLAPSTRINYTQMN